MDPALDLVLERGSKPLHVTIAQQLAAAIASGALAPRDRLPPERHLAETLGVSRMTVRQALGDLERDGLLRRVVGRAGGTFVAEPDPAQAVGGSGGLSAELRRQGGATSVEPISAEVEPAGRRVTAALDLKRSDRVVVITRLRLAGGKPLAVERSGECGREARARRGTSLRCTIARHPPRRAAAARRANRVRRRRETRRVRT
jgi:GntR family transcriptional regulator